ncbi:MAG TPA: hypothetical protein VFB62_13905 [Polyangiaceae bacterium]|jgi:hypothetical protein|nr:hypothetical protein [Polyangiaceae bacterium]
MKRACMAGPLMLAVHACIMVIPDSPEDACEPGTLLSCYEGPPATRQVGLCQDGVAVCGEEGELGACEREIGPVLEQCGVDFAEDEDCNGQTNEHCAHWVAVYGDIGEQGIEGVSLAAGDDVVVVARNTGGRGGGLINFGGAELYDASWRNSFAVARIGPEGEHRWSHLFTGGEVVRTAKIALDETLGVLVTGSFAVDLVYDGTWQLGGFATGVDTMFVARLDGDTGAILDSAAFTHDDFQIGNAVAGSGDAVFVAGSSAGYVDLGAAGMFSSAGSTDALLAKLDPDLEPLWARIAGGEGDDDILRMAVDDAGDVYVVGSFAQSIAFDPCPALAAQGERDGFVAKLAGGDGSCTWLRSFGGSGAERVGAIELGDSMQVAVMFDASIEDGPWHGDSAGDDDILIATLDAATGESLARRTFGAPGDQVVHDLALLPSGEIAVAGTIRGSIDFGGGLMKITLQPMETEPDDAFVLLLDNQLEHVFSRQFSAPGDDDAFGVVVAESGELVVGGEFANTIDFGTGAQASSGNSVDAYLMRLAP